MKLPTSNKTASFGKKPYVKKGYYPAKLIKVETFSDKEGVLVEGKHGHQLIFEFAIYNKDENDKPTVPMTFDEEGKDSVDVVIPKFVYHEYKDKEHPGKFQTAITPNSAITATLQALGWTFSEDDVNIDSFIGNWVEVNVNDFEAKEKDGTKYTASTIADIGEYEGSDTGDVPEVKPSKKPKIVKKEMKHEESEQKMAEAEKTAEQVPVSEESIEVLEAKIKDLDKLKEDELLTEEGHRGSVEQIQSKIDLLKK